MKRAPARRPTTALAVAIRRNDWELASLLLLDAFVTLSRSLPPGTIDDVLELIARTEEPDGAGR